MKNNRFMTPEELQQVVDQIRVERRKLARARKRIREQRETIKQCKRFLLERAAEMDVEYEEMMGVIAFHNHRLLDHEA